MQGETPHGLLKALGRLGEALWDAADYDLLLSLFSDDNAAQVLRHTDEIRPAQLRLIRQLPTMLRVPKILGNIPDSRGAAEDLAEAFRLAVRMQGGRSATAIVQRWERAGSSVRLFDMAAEDLQPVHFGGLVLAPTLSPAFVPVNDRKMLESVALEFRNCLRDFTSDIAGGRMAVYVLRDGIERAVLALRQDPAGWRLAEAKGKDNTDLREETLRFIVDAVERAGGRTGESSWVLSRRLHDHVCTRCGPAHVPDRSTWLAQLMLGTLWD
jgi:nucleotide-binding universal stress UspA family protein